MSTRAQRQDWQDFREKHGKTVKEFQQKWVAMFGRAPKPAELDEYKIRRAELKAPLGRKGLLRKPRTNTPAMANLHIRRTISMGHRLSTYDGICSSMHGHNVTFEVMLHTTKFTDFKAVDRDLGRLLEPLDHAMVLFEDDPFVRVLRPLPQRLVLLNVEPTTEAIAELIFNEMCELSWIIVEVKVYETDKYAASIGHGGNVKRRTELPAL